MSEKANAKRRGKEQENTREFVRSALELESDEQRQKLLDTLQYSAAALRLAVAYINAANKPTLDDGDRQRFGISDYLNLYKQKKDEFAKLGIQGDTKTISTTMALWLSLAAVEEREQGSSDARKICSLTAYFAPDKPIPVKLLAALRRKDSAEVTIDSAALRLLKLYAIFTIESSKATLTVDNSMKKSIRLISGDDSEATLEMGLEFLSRFELDSITVHHALSLWDHSCEHASLVKKYHDLIGRLMNAINNIVRDNEKLVEFGKRQIPILAEHLGPDHDQLLKLKSNLSIVMEHTGAGGGKREAAKLFKESTRILLNKNPDSKPARLVTRFNIALTHNKRGEPHEALKLLYDVRAECQRVQGVDRDLVMSTEGYIALIEYEIAQPPTRNHIEKLKRVVGEIGECTKLTYQGILSLKSEIAYVLLRVGETHMALKIMNELKQVKLRTV